MSDSIFSKIVRGEIPCHKVYEDERTLVFLDIHPVQPGHCLVIPKKEVAYVWDMDDEDYHAVMTTAKKVAVRLREALGVAYVGESVVGTDVPHAHVHLIPFNESKEYHFRPDLNADPDHESLSVMAKKLAF